MKDNLICVNYRLVTAFTTVHLS